MKSVLISAISFICVTSVLFGVDVEQAIKTVYDDPTAYEVHAIEARKLLRMGSAQETVQALLKIIDDDKKGGRKESAIRLMLALDPFPIAELDSAVTTETNQRNRAYALWFLNRGVKLPADIEKVVTHAKGLLSEEQEVFRTYGEAKGIAPLVSEVVMQRITSLFSA